MSVDSDLVRLAEQEARLRFDCFDLDAAWAVGVRIRDISLERGIALGIEVRLCRQTVFFCMMPGSSPNNADWIRRKRNTVELMQRSSYAVGLSLASEGTTLEAKTGLPVRDYASHGGGFPIRVKGVGCVGAVTVSGVPQRMDHGVVVEALAGLCGVPLHGLVLDPPD